MSYFSTGAELLAAINGLGADKIGSFVPFDAAYYLAQYGDKTDYDGSLSPLENFVKTGANKLYKPNAQFDPVFYANANPDLKALVNSGELNAADLLFHYLQYGLDEGRVATEELATGFDPKAYLAKNSDVKQAIEAAIAADENAFGGSVDNGAVAHYVKFGMAEGRPGGIDGKAIELEAGRDNLPGTAGNDTFYAPIVDRKNTFETGDSIDGGAGYDTLEIELSSTSEPILARLTGVEAVKITAQAENWDSGDNNITDGAQIDAQRTAGVVHWESNNSRADVVIEDVRILDNQITKDITIAFVDSDPGNVDFAVYFDQQSLRKQGASSTSQLTVSISNPLETSKGYNPDAPLTDVPYDQLHILLDGEDVTLELDLSDVETYDDLYEALQAAIAANPATAGLVEITRIRNGESFFSRDGEPRTADQFVLSAKDASLERAAIGWNASGGLPSDNAFSAIVTQGAPITESFLITSTVILDNVGRGSTGGDLLIGGLSVGDTSTSRGVEQFDITVERSSKLQQIASTNDTLEVVTITSGDQYREWANGVLSELKYGDLTVLGDAAVDPFNAVVPNEKPNLPGSRGDQDIDGLYGDHNGFGFTNVRVIDASDFHGKANLNVVLDERVTAKYMDLFDTQDDPAGDNIEFQYTLGTNDDNFFLAISAANFQAGGTTVREDFDLLIEGGAGNDIIDAVIYEGDLDDGNLAAGNIGFIPRNWYWNSSLNANLAINAGSGDDTVSTHGSGDWRVDLGTGDDTYYADNTGAKATWVLNAAPGTFPGTGNIRSDDVDTYAIIKGRLSVTLTRGDGSTYTTDLVTVPSAGGFTNDLQINQAIKEAINSDDVLSKLLKAEDGPANTLVVRSLIDEQGFGGSDLSINLVAPPATGAGSLTAADVSAYALAHGLGAGVTAAQVLSAINAAITGFEAAGDYDALLLQFGSLSGHTADNVIIGGAGDDVLVLGTGVFSNDTVVYEGFANGYDTIVNFDEGVTFAGQIPVPSEDALESFVVTFPSLSGNSAGTTVTITFDTHSVNLTVPDAGGTDSVLSAVDVARAFFDSYDAYAGANWDVAMEDGSNQVTFTAKTPGNVADVTTSDFTFSGHTAGTPSVTISDYEQGSVAYVAATPLEIELDLNGTVVVTAGTFKFDGVSVAYAVGDGALALADKLAAATFPNWTITDNEDGTVTVTAKTARAWDPTEIAALQSQIATDNPTLAADGIEEATTVISLGSDQVGTIEYIDFAGQGQDYLDFSAYNAKQVWVDNFLAADLTVGGTLTANSLVVRLSENKTLPAGYDGHTGEGVYLIELVNVGANVGSAADDTVVGVIGVADFGRTMDFVAENFIL